MGKSNDNLTYEIKTYTTSSGKEKKQLNVTLKKEGKTLIYLKDAEGTERVVEVNIEGKSVESSIGVENGEDVEDSSNKPEETTSGDSSIEDLIKELEKLFEENGIEINSVEGVEVNSVSEGMKSKVDNLVNKFKLKGASDELIKSLITKVNNLKVKYNLSTEKVEVLDYLSYKLTGLLSLKIVNVEYTENVDDGYLGGIYFETEGDIGDVGIDYEYYGGNNKGTQKDIINEQNEYAFIFSPMCEESCAILLKPYVIAKGTSVKKYSDNSYTMYYGEKLLNYNNTINQPLKSTDVYAKTGDGVDIAAAPLLYAPIIGLTVLGLTTTVCTDDVISIDCILSIIPVTKLGALIPSGVKTNTLKGVLYLNNKTNLTNYVNKFGTDLATKIFSKIGNWIIGVNWFKLKIFRKANPQYIDVKSTKAAYINYFGDKAVKFRLLFKNSNFSIGKLDSHYEKHVLQRKEWTIIITKEEYLIKAQKLLSNSPNSDIIEHVNKNGFIFKYNKLTNEFATGKPDGIIETLFKPEKGYSYMKEQIKLNP